jgi:hypothetical protein
MEATKSLNTTISAKNSTFSFSTSPKKEEYVPKFNFSESLNGLLPGSMEKTASKGEICPKCIEYQHQVEKLKEEIDQINSKLKECSSKGIELEEKLNNTVTTIQEFTHKMNRIFFDKVCNTE